MKFLVKHGGLFLLFIGALVIIVSFFTHLQTNNTLLMGWFLILAGFVSYIFLNKIHF
jgi:predicted phage tail protein